MADYEYLTETGVVVPQTSQILTEVQDEYKQTFGQDLVVTPDTPQGVLITAEALARAEVVNNNAALANQINPNVAGGVFLDAIMALLGLQRIAATRTYVTGVTVNGIASTVIPAGSQARTAAGDVFETVNAVTIGGGGSATVDFQSVEYGPIACGIGDLDQIVTNVLGWETVNNAAAGVLGANTQTDQAARAYRNNVLAFQAVGLAEAITSALWNVEGVKGLAFQENTAATTQTINGISMVAHSIWACVYGGSNTDVAAALLENKSSGCAWNGSTTVNLVEPASGQTYAVKFQRPTEVAIAVKVTTPSGNAANIKSAILAWAAGEVGGLEGFNVGVDVSPFEIASGINTVYPSTFISKVEVSLASSISWSTNTLTIDIDKVATIIESNITVVIS